MVIRCANCRQGHIRPCAGRGSGCRCQQCWTNQIKAEARQAIESSNSPQVLRAALMDVYALLIQRDKRRELIYQSEPVRLSSCACGCGQTVVGSRFGRMRRYVNGAHRQRVYDRRVARERRAAAALSNLGVPQPGGRSRG